MDKYRNFVFDVNGVLLDGPSAISMFTRFYDIPSDIHKEFIKYNKQMFRTNQYEEAYLVFNKTLNHFGIEGDLEKNKVMFTEIFNAEEIIEGVKEIVTELKAKGFNLYILSNEFRARTLISEVRFKDFFDMFDGAVYGWKEGMYKPDIRMWETIIQRYHIDPKLSVYVDDKEENREIGSNFGFTVFESVEEMNNKFNII